MFGMICHVCNVGWSMSYGGATWMERVVVGTTGKAASGMKRMDATNVAEWCISVRHAGRNVCRMMWAGCGICMACGVAGVTGCDASAFGLLAVRGTWRWIRRQHGVLWHAVLDLLDMTWQACGVGWRETCLRRAWDGYANVRRRRELGNRQICRN